MTRAVGAGRKKGQVTPQTHRFRIAIAKLLEMNEPNFMRWLTEIAEGNPAKDLKADPKGAMDILAKLAEYAAPKLARTEVVGDGGGPVELGHIPADQLDRRVEQIETEIKGLICGGS